jgi:hypothetical protein
MNSCTMVNALSPIEVWVHCLSAQRSWADCRLMPTARPMCAQDAPADLAAATVLSSRCPA